MSTPSSFSLETQLLFRKNKVERGALPNYDNRQIGVITMIPLIGILQSQKMPPSYPKIKQVPFLDLMIFSPADLRRFEPQVHGLLLKGENWVPQLLPLPQAVYNNVYTRNPSIAQKIEEEIGSYRVFNTITQLDKWKVTQILRKSPMTEFLPETRLYSWQILSSLFKTANPTIIKPRYGHLGHEIYLLRLDNSCWQLLRSSNTPLLTFNNEKEVKNYFLTHFRNSRWLVQDFVPCASWQGRIFDLRYLVQKGSLGHWAVTGTLSRVALKDYFVTNICKTILPVNQIIASALQNKLEEISLQTAQILDGHLGHLGEISVDFCLDDQEKPWIIEVNGLPAKELFLFLRHPPTLQKIYRFPLEYANYLAEKVK